MADRGEVRLRQKKIDALIGLYHAAYKDLVTTILDATDAGKIRKAQTMASIRLQLQDLGDDVDKWVKAEIPQYYLDGANHAITDLKAIGADLSGPKGLVPINKEAIASLTDSTSLAFAEGLTGITRNAQILLNDALKQQLNFIIADGTLKGEARKVVKDSIKQKLKDRGLTAIKDRAGRDWSFDRYAEMLVRTKAVEARNAGLANKMLQNGYDLVQVSNHGSTHPECAVWEGKILSISGNSKQYPSLDEATSRGLFHPNCQHAINVIVEDLASETKAYETPFDF